MKRFLVGVALTLSLVSTAFAWGPREQGALAGFAAGVILGQQAPVYVAPPPVYVAPPPVYVQPAPPVYVVPPAPYYAPRVQCTYFPVYDAYGRYVGQKRVCGE